MIKRLFDLIAAMAGLVVLLPLFLVTAILIKITSKGPVFYRPSRVGRHGRPFKMCKFRTMVIDADKTGVSSTADDDPRITKIGALLRKFKMDELPQLINVVKGEMSIVGPRPQIAWAVDLYTAEEKETILSVRPGITDDASIEFSNEGEILKGSSDPDRDYMEKIHPEKTRLSMEYVRNRSMRTDIAMIFRTLFSISKRRQ